VGLYSLTSKRKSLPLYRFRVGQATYPLPIRHGDTWSGEIRFKRIGPPETVKVRMALYVAGAYQWSEYTSVVLGRDESEQEYTAVVSGPYDSKGLPECQRIDTKMELVDSTGKVWQDTSTERFHNVEIIKPTDIVLYGKNIPAGANVWLLIGLVTSPLGTFQWSTRGSPEKLILTHSTGQWTRLDTSYTYTKWPPGGEWPSSFFGQGTNETPITLVKPLVLGQAYDFYFDTGIVVPEGMVPPRVCTEGETQCRG